MVVKNVKILREEDIYPGRKNGYYVEVTYEDGSTMNCLMNKEDMNKYLFLKKMKYKLSDEDYADVEKAMEEWGEFMYDKASDEAAMNAAGADL